MASAAAMTGGEGGALHARRRRLHWIIAASPIFILLHAAGVLRHHFGGYRQPIRRMR
jgi:cytochrome b561